MDKICIDNNMILSAVWFQQAQVNYSKTTKCVVFEKFTSVSYNKLQIMILLLIMCTITGSQDRRKYENVRALFVINFALVLQLNLHSCYNFALVSHENALRFQAIKLNY